MRDFRRALAGLGAKTRGSTIQLRSVPMIAAIEADLVADPGIAWRPTFEARCDEISLALFGVTFKDVNPKEPHPDEVEDPSPTSGLWMSDEAFASYSDVLDSWYDWQTVMAGFGGEVRRLGYTALFRGFGYDVTNGQGCELKCLPYFARQLYVAHKGLRAGAKVTLDGSGKRAPQSVEEWGAALAAEAAKFRTGR